MEEGYLWELLPRVNNDCRQTSIRHINKQAELWAAKGGRERERERERERAVYWQESGDTIHIMIQRL